MADRNLGEGDGCQGRTYPKGLEGAWLWNMKLVNTAVAGDQGLECQAQGLGLFPGVLESQGGQGQH